jgi:hypothetical protein
MKKALMTAIVVGSGLFLAAATMADNHASASTSTSNCYAVSVTTEPTLCT